MTHMTQLSMLRMMLPTQRNQREYLLVLLHFFTDTYLDVASILSHSHMIGAKIENTIIHKLSLVNRK